MLFHLLHQIFLQSVKICTYKHLVIQQCFHFYDEPHKIVLKFLYDIISIQNIYIGNEIEYLYIYLFSK